MGRAIDYEQRLRNFKSLTAFMYCQFTAKEETREVRFFGRAIDFTIFMFLVNAATSDAPSPLIYTAASCFIGSYIVYLAERCLASGKTAVAFTLLFLLLALASSAVGYGIHMMNNATKDTEATFVDVHEKQLNVAEIKEPLVYETIQDSIVAAKTDVSTANSQAKSDSGLEFDIKDIDVDQIELDSATEETFKQYASLISADPIKDADEFLSEYDELILKAPDAVDLILVRAISGGLEIEHLLDILNRGGELNGGHLSVLLTDRTLEEIKLLENYGLDIQQNTVSGRDVLADALLNSDREAVFDYLILNRGLDPTLASQTLLDVITRSEKLRLGDSYIKKLVQKGASLDDDDKKLVEELSRNNPEFYDGIIDTLKS